MAMAIAANERCCERCYFGRAVFAESGVEVDKSVPQQSLGVASAHV